MLLLHSHASLRIQHQESDIDARECTGVGEIVKLGPGVSKFKVGQRVTAVFWPGTFTGNGTWQQYLTAPEDVLVSHSFHSTIEHHSS